MWFFYTIGNAIKISLRNLATSKLRSFLTVLGVVIGVATVVIIFSVGRSAQDLILDQIKGVGSNLIGVLPGSSNEDGPPVALFGISVTTLTRDDLKALIDKKNVPEVEFGAAYVLGTTMVESDVEDLSLSFAGTTAGYVDVENAEIEKGRFFSMEEERSLSRVAVLGSNVANDLFRDINPINKSIKIKNQKFTVIGVFQQRGSTGFGVSSQDDSVIVPLKTAQKLILGINHLGFIRLKVERADLIELAKVNVKAVMRQQHDIDDPVNDDFSVRDQVSALNLLKDLTDILRYFLLSIGTVSLVVGGVSIMNIILIAVNQRIREIGVRRAIGAKKIDILSQFLFESATVSICGGIGGVVVGISISFVVALIIQRLGYNWKFFISSTSIFVALFISIIIGIVFGLYPAKKASKISPMEALRHE